MLCCLRLFRWCALSLALALLPGLVQAQVFTGEKIHAMSLGLKKRLTAWEVYRLDAAQVHESAKNAIANPSPITLHLSGHDWKLNLTPSNLLSENYKLQVMTPNGLQVSNPTEVKAFKGYESHGGGNVRLTLDDEFIYGFVEVGGETWYIEPLWYYDATAEHDLFVVYEKNAVIRDNLDGTCTAVQAAEEMQHLNQPTQAEETAGADFLTCYELELAIASDFSMFQKYGSVTGVENHNIGVINDVQNNYMGSFTHDIMITIVTQFVVSTAGGDPWTTSTSANTLLGSFRTWGNAGNFGVTFDVGELWTDRDFSGSTIGIAYVGSICSSFKYHCLQDFDDNAELLRCMTSHELGHNFDCDHDVSGCPAWIMCPSVSTTNTWSTVSINSINSFVQLLINDGDCLSSCGPPPPPLIADFDWDPSPGCQGQAVQFNDLSSGLITGYSWMFTNGTPATSTVQNPSAIWNASGTFNVKLTLQGTGGPVSITKQIVIQPLPVANFTYTVSGTTVNFNSTSTNATDYFWDFGDGGTSTEEDPEYTYSVGGFYTVTLTATNSCGSTTKITLINTAPTPEFSASPTTGCASLVVQFSNESSANASTYSWQFPGGIPSTSNQPNPVVTYNFSGNYTVTLTASNSSGSLSVTKTNYITVQNVPAPNFTYAVNGLTVNFTNNSSNATSYEWYFGDGEYSTAVNPSHTYAASGNYTVTLTAVNDCGEVIATQVVALSAPPTASFIAAPTTGCGSLTTQFTSTSTGNPTSYSWQFPGGTPTSSTAQNPSVVYSAPGSYTVTLTVSNVSGSNTSTQTNFIVVNTVPTVNAPANQTVCGGLPESVTFSGTAGATFNWTNSNTAIGLAASGTGNLNFTAANVTSVQTGTITVTPSLAGCPGTPVSFTITVNPTPSVTDPSNVTACAGTPVNVNFNGTPAGASFAWTNTNTAIGLAASGAGNINFIAANVGATQTGTLNVTPSLAGCTGSSQSFSITVNPAATAGFTSSVNGTTVSFTNTSGNATSYAWNFGDTGTSTQTNPSHTYAGDGTYTVTLTSTGPCGTATATQTVVIVTPPTAGFTGNPTSGCGPLTVQFTSTSSANAANFNWQFPGGTPASSTAQNPSVVYSTPGSYTVTLTVSNAAGSNTATQTNYVTVNPAATAGFTSSANGTTVSFTNTSNNATSYAWNFGDSGTSTQTNPTHIYASDGSYTVTLTSTGPCGTATATQTVVVATPPTAGFTANPTSGCGPLTVQFTSTSSANTTNYNWQFPGGTPSSSTVQNPSVVYSAPGLYTVTLTASNAAGSNTSTQTNLVNVASGPNANFTSSVAAATATFSNASTNATSYDWNFGDGNGSVQPNPVHTYTNDGTYTVVLTATNACGTSTFTQNVVIITSPSAGFTANTTSGCGPLTVQFTDLSSDNTTAWSWTFPGGNPATSTLENPVVVYEAPGSYDVSLLVTSAGGSNTFTQSNFITVLPDPTANFTQSVNGTTATFVNTSQDATSYHWDFGDGSSSNEENPTHTYLTDSVYTVTLTATNNCGTETFSTTVTIVTLPSAGIAASATSGCAPLTVQFTNASSANATSFLWTFAGGQPATATEENPSATWALAGTYTVTLIASNAAGSDTTTTTITVNTVPVAGFTAQTAGLGVVLTNTSVNATSYFWDFGDNSTGSTEANPTHNYGTTGAFTIVLKATNACGTVEFSQLIEVSGSAPLAAFSTNVSEGCAPLTVQFTDQSAGSPNSWSWTFPGGSPATSTAQNPTVTYSTAGTYTATLTATNLFGSNSTSQNIVVNTLPVAGFVFVTAGGTVSFGNLSLNALSYTWNFGDNTSSTEANPIHTYTANGSYTVELTAVNACGASTLQQIVVVTTVGANEPAGWVESFRLYPNPNSGAFTLEMQGLPVDELEFTLFNAVGQLIGRETAEFRTGTLVRAFDYGALPAGVYSLGIRGGDRTFFVKIVVQQ